MFEIRPLLNSSFWLDLNPPPFVPSSEKVLFAIFAIMLILGAIIRMVGSRRHEDRHVTETFNRFGRLLVTAGVLGLILFFFSYERIPFLSSRFWFLALAGMFVAWTTSIVYYVTKVVPHERKAMDEAKEKTKYIPKKKK